MSRPRSGPWVAIQNGSHRVSSPESVCSKPTFTPLKSTTFPAALLLLTIAACAGGPRVKISDANGAVVAIVRVEVADTTTAREVGLMYRQRLDSDAGMLFVFDQPQHLTFWMKNTEIPLDMIFARADGTVVGIIKNAEPFSERQLGVAGESQYVLEVNGGFTRRHGIEPGDRLKFVGLTPSAKD
jgi:uncharacterized membrane protein (UPF0127 family)